MRRSKERGKRDDALPRGITEWNSPPIRGGIERGPGTHPEKPYSSTALQQYVQAP